RASCPGCRSAECLVACCEHKGHRSACRRPRARQRQWCLCATASGEARPDEDLPAADQQHDLPGNGPYRRQWRRPLGFATGLGSGLERPASIPRRPRTRTGSAALGIYRARVASAKADRQGREGREGIDMYWPATTAVASGTTGLETESVPGVRGPATAIVPVARTRSVLPCTEDP